MAVFSGRDLKKLRESRGISAADLAERISVDVTTLYRYESGKMHPDPDVMYEICDALGDTSKWCDWMRTEYPISYARMHPSPVPYDMPGAIMSLYAVMDEIKAMRGAVFADGADGELNDKDLALLFRNQATRLLEAAQKIVSIIKVDEH